MNAKKVHKLTGHLGRPTENDDLDLSMRPSFMNPFNKQTPRDAQDSAKPSRRSSKEKSCHSDDSDHLHKGNKAVSLRPAEI
jgi:hypothetical protein